MIYNSKIESDQTKARAYLEWIINGKKRFELSVKREKRTDNQNRYLHLILSYFALEYGETLEYVKLEFFKKLLSPDIFKTERTNPKTGEIREYWRSSADIDTKEMTIAIERFRDWSSKESGIYIPSPGEKEFLDHVQNQIELQKHWL